MVVYALIDPCSNEIRYVGKTVRPLRGRLGQHFHPCRLAESSHKAHWLNNLAKRGLRPRVRILEVCDSENELAKAIQDSAFLALANQVEIADAIQLGSRAKTMQQSLAASGILHNLVIREVPVILPLVDAALMKLDPFADD